jgi:hypothetical protein
MRVPTFLALSASLFCANASFAAPAQVQHISVRTKVFADKKWVESPIKQYWIQGTENARVEGLKDPGTRDPKISILTPSDYWHIDPVKKKAMHVLPDRKAPLHFQIVAAPGAANELLQNLTYGNELSFFTAKHAAKAVVKGSSGANVDEYSIPVESGFISLQVEQKTNKPLQISLHDKDKQPKLLLQYVGYETIPFQVSLFKPPAGLTMTTVTAAQLRKDRLEMAAKIANYKEKLLTDMDKKNGTF